MREKPEEVHEIGRKTRITPACAGKNLIDESTFIKTTHHPRVCGKKLTDGISGLTGSGSPLHVQEKHFEDAVKICIRRITPACAGKTVFLVQMMKHHQDHPRVCGKNYAKIYDAVDGTGSPPRVREKRYQYIGSSIRLRITPACAGKTIKEAPIRVFFWDHPRVCGKNFFGYLQWFMSSGSPPRVREKR